MRVANILLIIFSSLCIKPIQASQPISFKTYQVEDGLSHNTVWCAIQDSYGFIWYGTSDGLNCYSGKTNKIYKNELNNEFSIENNYIQTLLELEDRNILAGTNRGLYLYDRKSDRFTYFDKLTRFGVSISSGIKKIIRAKNGSLWIGTMGQGFFIYDSLKDELTQNSFHTAFVCDMYQKESGKVYIASLQHGLFCFDEEGKLLQKHRLRRGQDDKEDYKINCLLGVGEDIWIGTASNEIIRFDVRDGSIESHLVAPQGVEAIQCLMEYDTCKILIGTDDGLYELDYKQKKVMRPDNHPESMSDRSVNALMRDAEGGIRILTNLGGVNYIAKSTKRFYFIPPVYQEGTAGSGKVIGPFCEDSSGNLWIGTRRGLCFFDVNTRRLVHRPIKRNNGKNYDIRSLLIEDNKMWMGTYGSGLLVMDTGKGTIKHYAHSQNVPNTICSDDVLSVYKTRNGDIYIGTSWGLCRYNRARDNFVTVTTVGMMVSVVDIHEDTHGYLWIATSNSGVFRLNINNGEWKHFHHETGNSSSITGNSIITLFEDSRGVMWFGTDGRGLCSFDKENECFINFDPNNKLIPNKVIYAIEEDASGDFWISGSAGLIRFNPTDKRTSRKFTISDGLQGNQFNFRSSLKTSAGVLFFGGINGFNMFLPETFTDNRFIPPVYVTEINFPHSDKEPAKKELSHPNVSLYMSRQITLPYIQNSFSLTFVSLSYEAPDNNRYSYILHGIDKDWIQDTESNTAFYTDLPPGKYEFEVRGSNNDGIWNEKSTALTIVITPPWWRSKIAYSIYILLLAGLFYYLAWLWNNHVRAKYKRRMEDFQVAKEQEIYKSKISFFINLVHEIRTPLTLIKLPLEKLQDEKQEERNTKYLSVIDRNVNYLLDVTNQLLDFQKMENGSFGFNPAACNINRLVGYVTHQFAATAELKGITLATEFPAEEVIAVTDKDRVNKILVNLISNAIKYADSMIEVKVYTSGENFYISVSDDGRGIPVSERDKIFEAFYQVEDGKSSPAGTGIGLAFSRSLAEGLNGSLNMSDSYRGGSTFTLSLPIGKVEELSTTGIIQKELIQDAQPDELTDGFEFPKRKFTVLLVEDNIDLLNLTRESLSEWFCVLKAHNGCEALEMLAVENPDVIVSDIMMPDMDGLELCGKVKSDINYSHIPIILLTAKTTLESKVEGFECGADAYLEKPFSVRQLRRQIENLLKLRLAYHKIMINLSVHSKTETLTGLSQKDCELMERIKTAIEKQLSDENFSIDSLAEALDMCRSNFYRKIKALTGMPPNDYLKVVRLNKAAELLKQNARISEVYGQVGFRSSSYFAKCFKAQFGMIPKDFAEKLG